MATAHTNKHINIVVHNLPKKLKIYLWIKEFVARGRVLSTIMS